MAPRSPARARLSLEPLEAREVPAGLPGIVPVADRFEPNDTPATATDLGAVAGLKTLGGLSVHKPGDADWFRFTTAGPGTATSRARIDFTAAAGDLDMGLYDAAGKVLARSEGASGTEWVSLAGLPAGAYSVRVYGFAQATSPDYTLTLDTPPPPPPPDRFEPNDTQATATNLGPLAGPQTFPNLSVHAANNADWFRFTTASPGGAADAVRIDFLGSAGNLDLELSDAAGKVLAQSAAKTANSESVPLAGLAAGTYFARVFGADGATNPAYTLAVNAPPPAPPVVPPAPPPVPAAWSVFVYITASNLEDWAFKDVNELEAAAATLPPSVQLVALWDQSAGRTTYPTGGGKQPAWGTTGRAVIAADTDPAVVRTAFEIMPEQDTGDPKTLANFLAWGKQAAPAQRYALMMWNHGGGLDGFNYDDADNAPADHMTTQGLAGALANPASPRLDVVGFDACLMGIAEVGFALRGQTAVYAASQESEYSTGHDYSTLFATLRTRPEATTAEALGAGFVASYQAQYVGPTSTDDTYSATRAGGYDNFAAALKNFVGATANATPTDLAVLRAARAGAKRYDTPDYKDAGSFFGTVANTFAASAPVRGAAYGVLNALNRLVIAKTADHQSSSGVSLYLPATAAPAWYAQENAAFVAATDWTVLLSRLSDAKPVPTRAPHKVNRHTPTKPAFVAGQTPRPTPTVHAPPTPLRAYALPFEPLVVASHATVELPPRLRPAPAASGGETFASRLRGELASA